MMDEKTEHILYLKSDRIIQGISRRLWVDDEMAVFQMPELGNQILMVFQFRIKFNQDVNHIYFELFYVLFWARIA